MNFVPAAVADGGLATALGEIRLTDRLRRAMERADAPREVILGIRPEHFEDASLVDDRMRAEGDVFTGLVDVVESMGSDKYVYYALDEKARSAELEELAADSGSSDVPASEGQLVTRLSAVSPVREGDHHEVWFDLGKVQLFDPSTGRNLTLEA